MSEIPSYLDFKKHQVTKKGANIGDKLNEFTQLKNDYKKASSPTKLLVLKQKQKWLKKKGVNIKI